MKTFKKICLKSVSNSLSDQEMRRYVGGYEDGYGEGYEAEGSVSSYCPSGENLYTCWVSYMQPGNEKETSGVCCARDAEGACEAIRVDNIKAGLKWGADFNVFCK